MAGIWEQFRKVEVEEMSPVLFGLMVGSTEREYVQSVHAVEDSQGL